MLELRPSNCKTYCHLVCKNLNWELAFSLLLLELVCMKFCVGFSALNTTALTSTLCDLFAVPLTNMEGQLIECPSEAVGRTCACVPAVFCGFIYAGTYPLKSWQAMFNLTDPLNMFLKFLVMKDKHQIMEVCGKRLLTSVTAAGCDNSLRIPTCQGWDCN